MPRFSIATRIVVLMQRTEFNLVSNTGHLIPKIFDTGEIRFRGAFDRQPLNTNGLETPDRKTVVLFPTPDATTLSRDWVTDLGKPITLIVPDGNWRQASKMIKRVPTLNQFTKIKIPEGRPTNYRLRSSPRSDGVCTFEAIARALGIIEGNAVQDAMENYFLTMVERVLWVRNKIKAENVYGGLPEIKTWY